jgi:hypothetical protein
MRSVAEFANFWRVCIWRHVSALCLLRTRYVKVFLVVVTCQTSQLMENTGACVVRGVIKELSVRGKYTSGMTVNAPLRWGTLSSIVRNRHYLGFTRQ